MCNVVLKAGGFIDNERQDYEAVFKCGCRIIFLGRSYRQSKTAYCCDHVFSHEHDGGKARNELRREARRHLRVLRS